MVLADVARLRARLRSSGRRASSASSQTSTRSAPAAAGGGGFGGASASAAAVAALLRSRGPPPTAAALCDALAGLTAPLARQLQVALVEYLTAAPALISGLVALVLDSSSSGSRGGNTSSISGLGRGSSTPDLTSGAAGRPPGRLGPHSSSPARHPDLHAAVALRLLADTPKEVRTALVAQSSLLKELLVALGPGPADCVRDRAAEVLRSCLVDEPAAVADALSTTPGALRKIIEAVPVSFVAGQLLARLIGAKSLGTPPDRTYLVPCHRKAICFLTRAQEELREHCLAIDTPPQHRPALVQAMAELSSRAVMLEKKKEDPDERIDGHFTSYMNFATPAAYNDARTALNLLESPEPIVNVLDYALAKYHLPEERALLPDVLKAISYALDAVWEARRSSIPSVRLRTSQVSTTPLSNALLIRLPTLIALLGISQSPNEGFGSANVAQCRRSSHRPLGILRLAIADVMISLLFLADSKSFEDAVNPLLSLHIVLLRLALSTAAAGGEFVLVRFSKLVVAVMESDARRNISGSVPGSTPVPRCSESTGSRECSPAAIWLADGAFLRLLTDCAAQCDASAMTVITSAVRTALSRPETRTAVSDDCASSFIARFPSKASRQSQDETTSRLRANFANTNLLGPDFESDLFGEDYMNASSEDDVRRVRLEHELQEAASRSQRGFDHSPLDYLPGRRRQRNSVLSGLLRSAG